MARNYLNKKIKEISSKIIEEIVEEVFNLINLYIKTTPNKIDDLILTFLPNAKEFILEKIRSINT